MRYRLRTLLILLAVGPPLLAVGYARWERYKHHLEHQRVLQKIRADGERQRRAWQAALMNAKAASSGGTTLVPKTPFVANDGQEPSD
jgi:hypothetical protein